MNAPAVAVLAVGAFAVGWFCLLGSWAGSVARPHVGPLAAVRVALWSGLIVATVTLAVLSIFTPLVGTTAVLAAAVVTAAAGGAWALTRWRRGPAAGDGPALTRAWWVAVPLGVLALVAIVVAHLAFGPVDNYDTGLYHLNAIQYAEHFSTVPGLANLHTRLGTNVSGFNLAAFGANTPFGEDAFRLVVGLLLLVLAVDVALRLLDGRPDTWRRPGTYVLLLAMAVCLPGLVAIGGATITSPSPDTLALIASLAAGAYLADAVATGERTWSAVAVLTAVLAASMRAQLWATFAVTVVVLAVAAYRERSRRVGPRALSVAAGVLAGLTAAVMLARDALLSGWLLFPATYLPLPVEWRVPEQAAESARDWILSWARDAGASPDQTLTSWYWLGPWARSTMHDWAVAGALGLLAVAALVWLGARGRPRSRRWAVLLAVTPAVTTVAVWFWTAPDPRFAWGAIVLVGAIPAGFAVLRLHEGLAAGDGPAIGAVPVMVAALLTICVVPVVAGRLAGVSGDPGGQLGFDVRTYDFGPVTVAASVARLPTVQTREFRLADGRAVLNPTESERCWAVFPACTPYQDATLRYRGPDVADGFASGP